jgi:hypothetical protein
MSLTCTDRTAIMIMAMVMIVTGMCMGPIAITAITTTLRS